MNSEAEKRPSRCINSSFLKSLYFFLESTKNLLESRVFSKSLNSILKYEKLRESENYFIRRVTVPDESLGVVEKLCSLKNVLEMRSVFWCDKGLPEFEEKRLLRFSKIGKFFLKPGSLYSVFSQIDEKYFTVFSSPRKIFQQLKTVFYLRSIIQSGGVNKGGGRGIAILYPPEPRRNIENYYTVPA